MRRLWLGLVLIAVSSAVLLLSDVDRGNSDASRMPHVAVLQHASQALLEEGVQGMLDGLTASGLVPGKNIIIERFNAENDVATGNAIARQITSGGYDLVITSSTRSLQAVANANRNGRVKHVFGIVADPSVAGVGISKTNPLDHPKHLVGIGSFRPPENAFRLARKMYPGLKSIGVAWNPSEANSEAFVIKAREACREMGLQLVEVAVDNSSGVGEASSSLVARGVDALWVGGDVTVLVAIDTVIAAAKQGRIPVFSITPPNIDRGALFDLGTDFHNVGKEVGELAAQVLRGADLTKIPIRNVAPERLLINRGVLKGLRDSWQIPPDVLAGAQKVIDGTPATNAQK